MEDTGSAASFCAEDENPFSQPTKTSRKDMNLSEGQNKAQQFALGNGQVLNAVWPIKHKSAWKDGVLYAF